MFDFDILLSMLSMLKTLFMLSMIIMWILITIKFESCFYVFIGYVQQ